MKKIRKPKIAWFNVTVQLSVPFPSSDAIVKWLSAYINDFVVGQEFVRSDCNLKLLQDSKMLNVSIDSPILQQPEPYEKLKLNRIMFIF